MSYNTGLAIDTKLETKDLELVCSISELLETLEQEEVVQGTETEFEFSDSRTLEFLSDDLQISYGIYDIISTKCDTYHLLTLSGSDGNSFEIKIGGSSEVAVLRGEDIENTVVSDLFIGDVFADKDGGIGSTLISNDIVNESITLYQINDRDNNNSYVNIECPLLYKIGFLE